MKKILLFYALIIIMGILSVANAQKGHNETQIASVYPDYFFKNKSFSGVPQIITGENFNKTTTELFVWSPEYSDSIIEREITNLGKKEKILPPLPPDGAIKIEAVDIERQVVVANIDGEFLWVKSKNTRKYSKPYLTNIAKPYWISNSELETGSTLNIYGEGLNTDRKTRIVLRHSSGAIYDKIKRFMSVRQTREFDGRLINFNLPSEIKPGNYTIFLHNGYGGEYGWVNAGHFKVVAKKAKEKLFNVAEYGAIANGLQNNIYAIKKAIKAAENNGGGTVFFPPGTYLIDETLQIPSGVSLLGSGNSSTIIRGIGYNREIPLNYWWTGNTDVNTAYSVITMTDNTSLKSLTVEGSVSKGTGGYGMIRLVAKYVSLVGDTEIKNICIQDCDINCILEDKQSANILYRSSIFSECKTKYLQLKYNQIKGSVYLQNPATRFDVIGNKFTNATYMDVVALSAQCIDSYIDSNIFTDFPGRVVINPLRHTYFRYNEVRGAFKGTWQNAEETFLMHGGSEKTVSSPTHVVSADKLVDKKQKWSPGQYSNSYLIVTNGKGFGQYRRVVDNTENTLILEKPFRVIPDKDSEYLVGEMFTENTYYGNINNSPTRMSLWLDCLANTVELYRDEFSGGIDIWGQDRSFVNKDGNFNKNYVFPSYYNMILNSWLDGSPVKIVTGVNSPSVYKGTPLFANFVANNKIRYPYMNRSGFMSPHSGDYMAGIYIREGAKADRALASYSVLANNYITYAPLGISIPENVDKTIVLNNEFNEINASVVDKGARTVFLDNKNSKIDNYRSEKKLTPRIDVPYNKVEVANQKISTKITMLKKILSTYPHFLVDSKEKQEQCSRNLLEIYKQLVAYENKEGGLPNASFYPKNPFSDSMSLRVILGKRAEKFLMCPSLSLDIQTNGGLGYLWNTELNGKSLKDIKNPSKIWVMADVAAAHEWMVKDGFAGHRHGVNFLFADGSVKFISPFSWDKITSLTSEL